MKIKVRVFANLVRYVPGARAGVPLEMDIPAGTTLGSLVKQLNIPEEEYKTGFVNGRSEETAYAMKEGDEVGIFSPIGGGSDPSITVDVWLYGPLSVYGGEAAQPSFANVKPVLPAGGTMADLLAKLGMPTEERGITFINGDLCAMPGVQPDLQHELKDGDRVAFFHLRSMWPFQYRHGIAMAPEMRDALESRDDLGIHHAYDSPKQD
jgi:sulfur-carrier protein